MDDRKKESYQVERTAFHDSAWYRLFDVLLNREEMINSINSENNDKVEKEAGASADTSRKT